MLWDMGIEIHQEKPRWSRGAGGLSGLTPSRLGSSAAGRPICLCPLPPREPARWS